MGNRTMGLLAPMMASAALALAASPALAQDADTLRLSLSDVVRMAAERSAQVELQRLAAQEGAARVAQERASLLPRVEADFTHGARTFNTASFGLDFPTPAGGEPLFDPNGEVVGPVTTIDVRGNVLQTLFDWGAIQRVRAARAALRADRSATDAARELAAAHAATAWVQARRALGRLDARSADVRLSEDLLDIARGQLAAGVGVRLDVTRAEAQRAAMEAELVTARANAGRALLALRRALNLPLDRPIALEGDFDAAGAQGALEADTALALEQRADVEELDRRVEAARLALAAVRAERWPTIAVVAGDGFTGDDYAHLLNTYEWALRVSLPLFDGRRGARADAARARAQALEVQRFELSDAVAFEVRDAALRLESARELVAASESRLELASAELEQARARLRAGVAGSSDAFIASLRLNEARSALVDARAELEAARVTLAIAEGTVQDLR